jgi:hypothetical protein
MVRANTNDCARGCQRNPKCPSRRLLKVWTLSGRAGFKTPWLRAIVQQKGRASAIKKRHIKKAAAKGRLSSESLHLLTAGHLRYMCTINLNPKACLSETALNDLPRKSEEQVQEEPDGAAVLYCCDAKSLVNAARSVPTGRSSRFAHLRITASGWSGFQI